MWLSYGFIKEYYGKTLVLSNQYEKAPEPIKLYCTSCMTDRVVTQKSKCRICGWKLLKPKHWDYTIRKLELISKQPKGLIPLEIKNELYFINDYYIQKFKKIDQSDYEAVGQLVNEIKTECDAFKI